MACGLSPNDTARLWPDVIPYQSSWDVRDVVADAISHIEANTRFRFVSWAGENRDYLIIRADQGHNGAQIGREPGGNLIALSQIADRGVVIHEICHRLGLAHEHTHPDHASNLLIHWDNILPDKRFQFTAPPGIVALSPYDTQSIMHYSKNAFATPDGATTLETRDGSLIGQRTGLSAGDLAGLRTLYSNMPEA